MRLKDNYNLEQSGIYKISINDKNYIGSAQNFKDRIYKHEYKLRKNNHANKHLQNLYNKYGESSLLFEIVEISTKENLLTREQFYLDSVENLINQTLFATNPTYKRLFSEEDVFKIAELYNSNISLKDICGVFGLNSNYTSQISRIAKGKIYIKYKYLFQKRKNACTYKHSNETKQLISDKHKKLSSLEVESIILKNNNKVSGVQLAKEYNVCVGTIYNILKGKYYGV